MAAHTTQYKDFDLHIWQEGDRYLAQVRNSPVGPSDKVHVKWPFGVLESHEKLLLKLQIALLKGRGYRSGPITGEEKILRDFGSEVFRAVFKNADDVAIKFASSVDAIGSIEHTGLRVQLHVEPPELAMLPWEFMFKDLSSPFDTRHNYLCLHDRTPLVRFLDIAGPYAAALGNKGPLKILGMIANPTIKDLATLDVERERRMIEEALKQDVQARDIQFEWVRGGTPDDLFNAMQAEPWHIFHFIGHGGVDQYEDDAGRAYQEGFVVMQDGQGGAAKVSAPDLGLMLRLNGNLRLAVLNCCDSASGSYSSTAAALVNAGVPAAVAMQFPISDEAAARFAAMFYKSLLSGVPLEQALTETRTFMRVKSNLEWAIPVLFTRSGAGLVFEVQSRPATSDISAPTQREPPARNAPAEEELRRLFG